MFAKASRIPLLLLTLLLLPFLSQSPQPPTKALLPAMAASAAPSRTRPARCSRAPRLCCSQPQLQWLPMRRATS